jgi:hypothetical protein
VGRGLRAGRLHSASLHLPPPNAESPASPQGQPTRSNGCHRKRAADEPGSPFFRVHQGFLSGHGRAGKSRRVCWRWRTNMGLVYAVVKPRSTTYCA